MGIFAKQTFGGQRYGVFFSHCISPVRAYFVEKLGGWSEEAISAEPYPADVPFLETWFAGVSLVKTVFQSPEAFFPQWTFSTE